MLLYLNHRLLPYNHPIVWKFMLATVLLVLVMLNIILYCYYFQVSNQGTQGMSIFTEQGFTSKEHYTVKSSLRTVESVCAETRRGTLPQLKHFLVDHNHKLVYCWIHKSASTSWIALFSNLANRSNIKKYYREIPALSTKSVEELNHVAKDVSYHKFVVVRHPFTRLVSAYRDRFEDNSRYTSQAYLYAPSILRKTRPSIYMPISKMFLNGRRDRLVVIPTFEEFIRWLIAMDPDRHDLHWNLYTDHCSLCTIKYDTIIKLENFEAMKHSFMKKIRVDVKHLQVSKGGPTTFHIACKYFSQLSLDQIQSLYQIYKPDFEMFDYSIEEYVKCATQEYKPSL